MLKDSINAPPSGAQERSPHSTDSSRRQFFKQSSAALAGAAVGTLSSGQLHAQGQASDDATLRNLINAGGRPILIKEAIVLSMDRQVGDFENGDVLVQGKKIVAVGSKVDAPKTAIVVNAAGMILVPGFVDTHHHQYESLLRSALADGLSALATPTPKVNYGSLILRTFTPVYTPEDARISELLSSLSQISAGVTTSVDTSQVHLTPEHTDACIAGLKEARRRAVFAYGPGVEAAGPRFTRELARLRMQYFTSNDQLLTLATHGRADAEWWKASRGVGVPIVTHIIGTSTGDLAELAQAGLMGPDNEYIHCTRLNDSTWKTIADTGGKVSIAPAIEMQMQQGYPPLQQALDHKLQPSLSVDVECNMTADLFSVMRAAFLSQRALVNERMIKGEQNVPPLLTCRQVLEMATINGARVAHLDSKIGSITPGKEADLILLATDRINVFPLNNVPGTIVTLMDTRNVEHVFIGGTIVKWRGDLVGVDVNRLRQQSEQARDGLFARAKVSRDLFGSCCMP
jgi:5-methylthioadenosine/S-adenosylhomocysteine deaminase